MPQKSVQIHPPTLRSSLPAHERAARRSRVRRELPAAPSPARRPAPQPTSGRKTFDTRTLFNPFLDSPNL